MNYQKAFPEIAPPPQPYNTVIYYMKLILYALGFTGFSLYLKGGVWFTHKILEELGEF